MFSEDPRFNVVATASDGERLLDAVARIDADVVVMGWVMPYLDGEGVLRRLRERPNAPRVVVYTGLEDSEIPKRAMALGGAAYVSKQQPPEELLDTVGAVAAGRMVFPYLDVNALEEAPLGRLTPREHDVLAALASGRTVNQIAGGLGVSPNTLKFHIKNLYDKLGVRNRAQAVVKYLSAKAEP